MAIGPVLPDYGIPDFHFSERFSEPDASRWRYWNVLLDFDAVCVVLVLHLNLALVVSCHTSLVKSAFYLLTLTSTTDTFHPMNSSKYIVTVTANVLVSDADAKRLRLDTRLGRQSVEHAIDSHLASGPLLLNRETGIKVTVNEALAVDRNGLMEVVAA